VPGRSPSFNSPSRERRSFTSTAFARLPPSASYPSHSFWARIVLLLVTLAAAVSLLNRPFSTSAHIPSAGLTTAFTTSRCNYRHRRHTPSIITRRARRHTAHETPALASPALNPRPAAIGPTHETGPIAMHHHVGRSPHVAASTSATHTLVDRASRVLIARSSSTCTNDSDPGCTKPTQVPTLAITMAAM
jgi:hypothetical protein